jgi:hypothetical protein
MSKIIKYPIPLNILFDLLDEICLLKDKYYVLDDNSFNKMKYLNIYEPFIQKLKECYFPNKLHYLKETPNFREFIVIIKQICKYNNLNISIQNVHKNGVLKTIYNIYI